MDLSGEMGMRITLRNNTPCCKETDALCALAQGQTLIDDASGTAPV
jgi:hypothetical protein